MSEVSLAQLRLSPDLRWSIAETLRQSALSAFDSIEVTGTHVDELRACTQIVDRTSALAAATAAERAGYEVNAQAAIPDCQLAAKAAWRAETVARLAAAYTLDSYEPLSGRNY